MPHSLLETATLLRAACRSLWRSWKVALIPSSRSWRTLCKGRQALIIKMGHFTAACHHPSQENGCPSVRWSALTATKWGSLLENVPRNLSLIWMTALPRALPRKTNHKPGMMPCIGLVHEEGFHTLKVGTTKTSCSCSLIVPMELHGVNVRLLVDTGAVVTVLSSRVYQALSEALRPPLEQPPEALKLEVANDQLLAIDGVVDKSLTLMAETLNVKCMWHLL